MNTIDVSRLDFGLSSNRLFIIQFHIINEIKFMKQKSEVAQKGYSTVYS